MSQDELAKKLGYKSRSSINKIEMDSRNLTQSKIKAIADALETTPSYIMGWDVKENTPDGTYPNIKPISVKRFPVLGNIACGEPIFAEEEHESYITAAADIHADFCLIAKGDSMINARIYDGDVVFIRSQPTVNNGEIAAVIIGDEATLKRVYIKPGVLQLVAENPAYEPMVFTGDELESVRILGKAVCFMSQL